MVRKFLLLAAVAACAAPAGSALAQSKIGVVQIERIVRDSVPAVRAQKKLEAEFAKLRDLTAKAGHDPAKIGLEIWMSVGAGNEAQWREDVAYWKRQGASHITLTTAFNRRHHRRIPGHDRAEHLQALRRFRDAVADAL